MRVRRKSTILDAVLHKDGYWQLNEGGIHWNETPAYFAAHYEPVPEPPAREEDTLTCQCVCHVPPTRAATQHRDAIGRPVPCYCAAPSVSEEQPAHYPAPRNAPYGLDWPPEDVPPFNGKPIPAPHRATIALIPCPMHKGMFQVTKDGVYCVDNRSGTVDSFCGTEAEAKAKMESLRGGNNGA